MPLPVSSQVFIPNPLTPVRAGQAGFDIGTQSSDFANITKGVFEGVGFADDLRNNQSVRETRSAQIENQQKNQELNEKKFEFEKTIGQENKERALEQQDRQLDIAQQRADDAQANRVARESRMRSEAAIERKKKIREAEYQSTMTSLIADGNPDPFIASVNDPRKRGEIFRKISSENREYSKEAVKSLEDAIISGRISKEALPQARSALQTLERAPGIVSSREAKALSAQLIHGETGFEPQDEAGHVKFRVATVEELDRDGAEYYIEQVRDDGTTRSHPYRGDSSARTADIQRAINNYNQQLDRAEDVRKAVQATSKKTTPAASQNEQNGSTNEAAPAQSSRPTRQLGSLTNEESTESTSSSADPQETENAKNALRQRLREKLKANGR